ncbi:hypothetical protein FSC37_20140 [Piscinibacter aquaticus]|uniref:Uncharacterized protein n=1 Tax=Piscinibacter aquaticus TaxID=392597 RepID=A0A5C6U2X4_9BURK|nr:hypothetical protein FSC37_20140 [Piscinibacter aquaticus]
MKIAIWIVCGLLAALWTGGAFAAAALTEWASGLIASGAAVDMGRAVAEWPVPARSRLGSTWPASRRCRSSSWRR